MSIFGASPPREIQANHRFMIQKIIASQFRTRFSPNKPSQLLQLVTQSRTFRRMMSSAPHQPKHHVDTTIPRMHKRFKAAACKSELVPGYEYLAESAKRGHTRLSFPTAVPWHAPRDANSLSAVNTYSPDTAIRAQLTNVVLIFPIPALGNYT